MADDNRVNLLRQALQLFAARGYDAVGVQEIAAAADVTKPTLYHYFGSKRGLLDALLESTFLALLVPLEEAAAFHGDLPLNLERVTGVYFAFARQHPLFYRMQLSMQHAPPDSDSYRAVLGSVQVQQVLLETLFRQALPHMKGRHQRYAITLLGMVNTYVLLWLNGAADLDNELRRQAVHQYMHGIYS